VPLQAPPPRRVPNAARGARSGGNGGLAEALAGLFGVHDEFATPGEVFFPPSLAPLSLPPPHERPRAGPLNENRLSAG